VRDAEAVGEAIRNERPDVARLLDEAKATLVPVAEARALGLLGPDESYAPSVPDIDEVRRKLVLTLKAIGKLQTGQDVALAWCHRAASILGEQATGECDFDLHLNDNPDAVQIVLAAAEAQLTADLKAQKGPADPDIPF
jgi:hypothetical protein